VVAVYPHTKLDGNRKNFLWTYGRTDGRTDRRTHLSSNLLGHRRGDDLTRKPRKGAAVIAASMHGFASSLVVGSSKARDLDLDLGSGQGHINIRSICKTQTASRSIQLFLQLTAEWRHLANTMELVIPSARLNPQCKRQIDRLSRFCTADGRKSLYFTTIGASRPITNISPSHGGSGLDLHLTHHCLGLPDSSTQTASRSLQPFLQGSLV